MRPNSAPRIPLSHFHSCSSIRLTARVSRKRPCALRTMVAGSDPKRWWWSKKLPVQSSWRRKDSRNWSGAHMTTRSLCSSATRADLPPSEQPLDVREFHLHIGRPAVIALTGIRDSFHLAQERVHLGGLEPAACAHRTVAGHGCRDVQKTALQRQGIVPFRHVLGKVADQPPHINLAQQGRGFAHRDGARTKRFDNQAKAGELFRASREPRSIALVEFHDLRNEQDLPCNAGFLDRGLHAL